MAQAKRKAPAEPQEVVISYAARSPFQTGLRDYMTYRDLGMKQGTHGMVQAHVLRAAQPCPPGGTGWHLHDTDFQMIYVLKGSITTELEGKGVLTFASGDCWSQPPKIRHRVLAFSSDFEAMEIISPADFATVDAE